MIGIYSVITILLISILVTKIAAIALYHTGLSRESAKFQARSAFTGVGFTTSESEKVVNHPVRRRILLLLMILGNAGIVTAVASLITGFTGIQGEVNNYVKALVLVVGITLIWTLANSHWLDRRLGNVMSRFLNKYTSLNAVDYASLLNLTGDYRISEMYIHAHHWLCNKHIKETQLRNEGVIILAVTRSDGEFIGAPQANTQLKENNSIILYGRATTLSELDNRSKGIRGNLQHKKQVRAQKKNVKAENKA